MMDHTQMLYIACQTYLFVLMFKHEMLPFQRGECTLSVLIDVHTIVIARPEPFDGPICLI